MCQTIAQCLLVAMNNCWCTSRQSKCKSSQAWILKGVMAPCQTNPSKNSLTSMFLPNLRFTKHPRCTRRRNRDVLWHREQRLNRFTGTCLGFRRRWLQGQETFVTGLSQRQPTGLCCRSPRSTQEVGLSHTLHLPCQQGLHVGPNIPRQMPGTESWGQ